MKNRAFTLIELLVVVLIIGILAAIAVSQYQDITIKSKISGYLPFIKALAEAQEVYYLQNGQYAYSIKKLDVSLPESCRFSKYSSSYVEHNVYCEDNIMVDNQSPGNVPTGRLTIKYCPGFANDFIKCASTQALLQINFFLQNHEETPGEIHCKSWSDKGKAICQKFAGQMIID